MPEAFVAGLNDNTRSKAIDLLNARLADVVSLALAVKQAHWNIKGPGFIGVHEMLDEVADRLRDSSDLIAERAVILGGFAYGTAEVVAEKTTMAAYPLEEKDIQIHIEALRERFLNVGEKVRGVARRAVMPPKRDGGNRAVLRKADNEPPGRCTSGGLGGGRLV